MGEGKNANKGKLWYSGLDEDSIDLLVVEVEDLENDELSLKEAGFLYGYNDDYADYTEEDIEIEMVDDEK